MAQTDYITNDHDLLKDIAARADQRVAAQMATALAADQRAMTFGGLLAAASAVVGGGAASVLTAPTANLPLGYIALAAALILGVGSALAIYAARPTIFYLPGTVPSKWQDDIKLPTTTTDRLASLLFDYDERIAKNESLLKRNGRLLMISAATVLFGLLLCGVSVLYFGLKNSRAAQVVSTIKPLTIPANTCKVVVLDGYRNTAPHQPHRPAKILTCNKN